MKTNPVQWTALMLFIVVVAACGPPPKEPLGYLMEGGIKCGLRSPGMLRGDWYLALEFPTAMVADTDLPYAAYTYETSTERITLPLGEVPDDARVCRGEVVSDARAYNGPLKIYRRRDR